MHGRDSGRILADWYFPTFLPFVVDWLMQRRRLTEALLFRDFELVVTIPGDRLCPTVRFCCVFLFGFVWLDGVSEWADRDCGRGFLGS